MVLSHFLKGLQWHYKGRGLGLALFLCFISACANTTVAPLLPPVAEPVAPVFIAPPQLEAGASLDTESAIVEAQSVISTEPRSVPKVKPEPTAMVSVAILLSEKHNSSQQIADALAARLQQPVELFYLPSPPQQQLELIALLQQSAHQHVVTIGSNAAKRAQLLHDKRVVFSQVFNYQEEGLLEAGFTGVSMIPSADVLFAEWKKLSPGLSRVAIITGPDNRQQIALIASAAQRYGISILHKEAVSDKEMLYEAKQLTPLVQGFWLLPDHRILSRRGMKDFMMQSMKQGKQVALFNRQLFKYGGLIYAGGNAEDIAAQIEVQLLTQSERVLPLLQADIEVNPRAVEQLHLAANQ